MKLEQSDAELFYQLWFPLLDFVNRKHHVCPETETIGQRKGIDARNAKKTLGCLLLYAARFDAYVCAADFAIYLFSETEHTGRAELCV